MFCIFFKSTCPIHVTYLSKGETVDALYYIEHCIKPVVKAINRQRPKSGTLHMKFLHDNARHHAAKLTKSQLEEVGFKIIRHLPYSPDLSPCDFWLFDLIKRQLVDATDEEDLNRQITKVLGKIPQEEFLKTFEKWLERMQMCITNKGDYFEHLIK